MDRPARLAEARRLLAAVAALQADVEARQAHTLGLWDAACGLGGFGPSAANLAAWLALRRTDLSALQEALAALGLSSLGRCEGHVMASIQAVRATLAVLAEAPGPLHPPAGDFAGAAALLACRRDALFGVGTGDSPSTRIMVTLPAHAADAPDLVADLVAAKADCLRINTAHDGPEVWARMAGHLRAAAAAAGRRVPLLMDLGGPKLRIATVNSREKIRFNPGDRFSLSPVPVTQGDGRPAHFIASLSHPGVLEGLSAGAEVWIDDGVLRARVLGRQGALVDLEVTHARARGGRIKPDKGVNLPGRTLDIPALTPADRAHLAAVMEHADMVGLSFVQTPGDVRALLSALEVAAPGRRPPAIVLKIETPRAVANLPALIVEAGCRGPVAVMIARGDLAVEIGMERLSEVQEEMLWLCEAAQVPVVWATQVLEGLLKEGLASRAETTDAAMAQRADCVMLNKGPHAVQAVGSIRDILRRMDRHQHKKTPRLGQLNAWTPEAQAGG